MKINSAQDECTLSLHKHLSMIHDVSEMDFVIKDKRKVYGVRYTV